MGHLQSGRRVPVPASPVARQGQQPAVLALLPPALSHSRVTASLPAPAAPNSWQGSDGSADTLGSGSRSSAALPLRGRKEGSRAAVPLRAPGCDGSSLCSAHGTTGKRISSLERG